MLPSPSGYQIYHGYLSRIDPAGTHDLWNDVRNFLLNKLLSLFFMTIMNGISNVKEDGQILNTTEQI